MTEIINVQNAAQVERSADEKKEISQLKVNLYEELKNEKTHGEALETCRIKLGMLLNDVQDKKVWGDWGFKSYGDFLESIAPMVHKGRTSLYNYADVSRQLLPYISPEELPEVGITKARALASAVKKNSGKRPSDTLLNAAKSPAISVEEMHQLIADNYGARDETEKGIWLELGGFFLTDEEKTEFNDVVSAVIHTDPVLPYNAPWKDLTVGQKKEVFWRLGAEYISAHPEVVAQDDEVFGG